MNESEGSQILIHSQFHLNTLLMISNWPVLQPEYPSISSWDIFYLCWDKDPQEHPWSHSNCVFFHKETSFAVLPSLKWCTRLMNLTTLNEIISALILKSSGNELYSQQINNHHIRKKTILLQYWSSFSACVTVSLLFRLAWNNSAFKTALLCLVMSLTLNDWEAFIWNLKSDFQRYWTQFQPLFKGLSEVYFYCAVF